LQVFGVGFQKLVGQVIGIAHRLGRLLRPLDRDRLGKLGFPKRHGVDEGRVDLGDKALSFSCTSRIEGRDCIVT
jgi:hypothetical protein